MEITECVCVCVWVDWLINLDTCDVKSLITRAKLAGSYTRQCSGGKLNFPLSMGRARPLFRAQTIIRVERHTHTTLLYDVLIGSWATGGFSTQTWSTVYRALGLRQMNVKKKKTALVHLLHAKPATKGKIGTMLIWLALSIIIILPLPTPPWLCGPKKKQKVLCICDVSYKKWWFPSCVTIHTEIIIMFFSFCFFIIYYILLP